MWILIKTAFAFAAVDMAANELGVPDWARFIGWALILAGYVAHSEKMVPMSLNVTLDTLYTVG